MTRSKRVDSMKGTIRREKGGGGRTSPAPGSGSGARGGNPTEPPMPAGPKSGAPYTEPGLVSSGKRAKRTRGY